MIIMLAYARSGGTLLNKCLASLPDVVMMSEVNPLGGGWGAEMENSHTTIKSQAKNWYGIELESEGFRESAIELDNYCVKNNKTLIIRDWSFVSFTPYKDNNFKPPCDFETYNVLEDQHVKLFALVRDSIDVWISRGMQPCQDFFIPYQAYVNRIIEKDIPYTKYEDFTKNPKGELKKICKMLGMKYKNVSKSCLNYSKVNGDVQMGNESRGIKQRRIKPMKRKSIPEERILEINNCNKMKEVNGLFGYPTYY